MDKNTYFNAEEIVTTLQNAIDIMKSVAEQFGLEDEPDVQGEMKAYQDILNGLTEENLFSTIQITKCENCKKHRDSSLCEKWSQFGTIQTEDSDFCSYGEQ